MNSKNTAIEVVPVPVSELGEGPVWDAQQQRIIWVDIEQGKIHSYYPATKQYKAFEAGQMVGAVALTRVLSSLLFETDARDPWTLGVTALVLVSVALFAALVPALRGTRIAPTQALRVQ